MILINLKHVFLHTASISHLQGDSVTWKIHLGDENLCKSSTPLTYSTPNMLALNGQ